MKTTSQCKLLISKKKNILTHLISNRNRIQYKVDADKGFRYSQSFKSYVCQRKNHFQVSLQVLIDKDANYVRVDGHYHKIDHYRLNIYAVRDEQKTEKVKIKQSNKNDQRHLNYEPLIIKKLELNNSNHVSAKRLHFGEITRNNKPLQNNMPNQKQRYFILNVDFEVVVADGLVFKLHSIESEKIIVRVIIII